MIGDVIFSERFKLIQECVEEKHKIIGVPIMLISWNNGILYAL
jgi:hypothetical protein